ncbi:MAG: hypothetical protein BWK79_19750 [Beggiatoa sp. IS2]|nr:MAG: hypothetical protein BWK79_19750 [Beggiatoa sp. IS2]
MLRYSLTLLLLLWTTTLFATVSVVGKIEDLACPSDYYSLERQGEPLPVRIFTELQAGDKLALKSDKLVLPSKENGVGPCKTVINPETPILSISLNGKPNQIVKLPYTVPAGPAIATTTGNVISQISSWLNQQHDNQLKVLVSLTGKANDSLKPQIAVLKGNHQKLLAGDRKLLIAWQFGKPPFTVTISGNGGQPQTYHNLLQRKLQQRLKLMPGRYRLTLKDANQQTADYSFTVVDSQLQLPSSQKLRDLTDQSARLVAQTLCLAVQDKGIWRFEAIQQIAQLAESDAPAKILRDALLQNAEISPLDLLEGDCAD